MANSKVILGEETLMDITDTTAEEENVLEGITFYGADGAKKTGVVPTRKITDTEKENFEDLVSKSEDGDLIIVTDEEGQGGGSSVNVIDNLESTSSTDALSANQGRLLNEEIADIYNDGFASKNLFDATLGSTLQSGITITRNSDGSYTVNGTTTAQIVLQLGSLTNNGKYKLVGCPSGGSSTTYMLQVNDSGTWGDIDSGDGLLIEISSSLDLYLVIRNGVTLNNLVFKPMLTKDLNATYSDYQPYAESNVSLTSKVSDIEDRGFYSKNLLNHNVTSKTSHGITITVNEDKSIKVVGTPDQNYDLWLVDSSATIPKGRYIVSGLPNVGSYSTVYFNIKINGWSASKDLFDLENVIEVAEDTNYAWFILKLLKGVTYNHLVKPMIRKATIEDDTYVPYAKSNTELTELTNNTISDEWTSRTYSIGEYCIYNNKLWKCLVQNNVAPSEGANWTQVSVTSEIKSLNNNLSKKYRQAIISYSGITLPTGINVVTPSNIPSGVPSDAQRIIAIIPFAIYHNVLLSWTPNAHPASVNKPLSYALTVNSGRSSSVSILDGYVFGLLFYE